MFGDKKRFGDETNGRDGCIHMRSVSNAGNGGDIEVTIDEVTDVIDKLMATKVSSSDAFSLVTPLLHESVIIDKCVTEGVVLLFFDSL